MTSAMRRLLTLPSFAALALLAGLAAAAPRGAAPHPEGAQMGAPPCEGAFVLAVDTSRAILVGRPKSIAKSQKGTMFRVLVTYTITKSLFGPKPNEVTVEETCRNEPVPYALMDSPSAGAFCVPAAHALPGLTADGSVAGGDVVLLLRHVPSAGGSGFAAVSRETTGASCPDAEPLYKKRTGLRELVKRVLDARVGSSYGFPAPPPRDAAPAASTAPAPTASATQAALPASATAAPSVSDGASPAPSSSAGGPLKRFGCAASPASAPPGVAALIAGALALAFARRAPRREPPRRRR